jgi:hypothetical protein
MMRIVWSKTNTALLFILILVVDALGQLTRIRRIADGTVLPILVVHEFALEIESVVDVCKAKLDIRMLE